MSHSIFITSPTALIAQPGRAVNTFPSGLVRVDQTYLGLTSQAATHRATLAVGNNMPDGNSSPCIDGLKIFPEVQERRREDGFTEFIVSAYGRTNTTGRQETSVVSGTILIAAAVANDTNPLSDLDQSHYSASEAWRKGTDSSALLGQTTVNFVDLANSTLSQTIVTPVKAYKYSNSANKIFDITIEANALQIYNPRNLVYGSLTSATKAFYDLTRKVSNFSKTNFGAFDEYKISFVSDIIIQFRV